MPRRGRPCQSAGGHQAFCLGPRFSTGDCAELPQGLLNLLQLLLGNVGELVVEDRWLVGQIAVVRDIFSVPSTCARLATPISISGEVIFKQSQLYSLNEARESLKQMLAVCPSRRICGFHFRLS